MLLPILLRMPHLGHVSIRYINESSLRLSSREDVFLLHHLVPTDWVARTNTVCFPLLIHFLRNQSMFQDRSHVEVTSFVKNLFSILFAIIRVPSSQKKTPLPPNVLESHECMPKIFEKFHNTGILLCCFLVWIWSIDSEYLNSSAPFPQNHLNNFFRSYRIPMHCSICFPFILVEVT